MKNIYDFALTIQEAVEKIPAIRGFEISPAYMQAMNGDYQYPHCHVLQTMPESFDTASMTISAYQVHIEIRDYIPAQGNSQINILQTQGRCQNLMKELLFLLKKDNLTFAGITPQIESWAGVNLDPEENRTTNDKTAGYSLDISIKYSNC